jgi:hypothetical protein
LGITPCPAIGLAGNPLYIPAPGMAMTGAVIPGRFTPGMERYGLATAGGAYILPTPAPSPYNMLVGGRVDFCCPNGAFAPFRGLPTLIYRKHRMKVYNKIDIVVSIVES